MRRRSLLWIARDARKVDSEIAVFLKNGSGHEMLPTEGADAIDAITAIIYYSDNVNARYVHILRFK